MVALLPPLLKLSAASTHVCNVYDAPDGETVCSTARSTVQQVSMSAVRVATKAIDAKGFRAHR